MSSIRERAAARTTSTALVEVPEWDVTVEVRSISVNKRREILNAGGGDTTDVSLRMLVTAVFDPESGEPAFTVDDLEMLGEQDAALIDRLLAEVMGVSGATREAVEAGKGSS